MATLFNTKISQTYEGLIKTIDNSAISTSLKELTDGSGNQLGLFVDNQGNFKATNIVEFGGLQLSGVVINKIVTSADGIENFNNDTSLPTSAAVKTYVDNIVTIQDLDFGGNSGGGSVDLDSEIFMLIGTNGIVTSASGSNALSISGLALETSINTNTSNIVVNAQNIATNTSNIALNVSDIATNVANISTNATNISTNATGIAANVVNISTNAQSIASTESSLAIEIVDRQNADINLQTNIDTETASRILADNILTTNLANEVSDRQSADTILQGNIDAEETARISADNTLQANINAEATTRANEDTTLQANINTEAGLRSSADTLLQSNIDAEELARQGADTTLQNNIDTEESARISADTTLQTNITSEQNSRIAADTTLQNQITLNDTDITNLQNDKQNISEKGQASGYVPLDANAKIQETYLPASVLGGLSYQGLWNASTNTPTLPNPTTVKGHYYVVDVAGTYQGQVYNVKDWVISDGVQWGHVDNTESVSSVFGRLGNVVANQSDYSSFYPLISDLSNEITNRTNADITLQNNINTEASTRATDDTTLQTNIDNEATARTNADTNLQTNISNEASTRASADTNLQLNIDAEETARISADTTLQNNINAITLASLGFTGDTNANYITNNNQLINGAGYLTTTSASTTYLPLSAGSGKPLSGDLYITKADTPLVQLLDTTNNKTLLIGVDNSNAFIRSGAGQKLLFQVNGGTPTAALTLLNNGYVGIGTDNPIDLLHIKSTITDARMIIDAHTGFDPELKFFESGVSKYTVGYDSASANFVIGTSNVDTNQRLVINSVGYVGIGTTSPDYKLDVEGSANNADIGIRINNTFDDNLATSNPNSVVFLNAASNNGYLRVHGAPANTASKHQMDLGSTAGSSFLTFSPSGSERMRITSDGKVGIGTNSPSANLEVLDPVSGNFGGEIKVGGVGSSRRLLLKQDTVLEYLIGAEGSSSLLKFGTGTGSTEKMRIATNGYVGIGTDNPSAKLDIKDNDPRIRLTNSDTSLSNEQTIGAIDFYTSDTSSQGRAVNAKLEAFADDPYGRMGFRFYTGGGGAPTDKMRILSNGNVGIGENNPNPSQKLHVVGNARVTGAYYDTNNSAGSSGQVLSSTETGTDWIDVSGGGKFVDGTNPSNAVYTTGRVGIGTASPSKELHVNSGPASDIAQFENSNGSVVLGQTANLTSFDLATGNAYRIRQGSDIPFYIKGDGRKVGIGTDSPNANLHVKDNNTNKSVIMMSAQNGVSNYGFVRSIDDTSTTTKLALGTTFYGTEIDAINISSGRVGINKSSPSAILDVSGNGVFTQSVTASSFNTSSDERLKENIEKASGNTVNADWKTFELKTEKGQKRYGVIAQELEKVHPEFVITNSEGIKSVSYTDLLIAKIAELELRIQKLEK